MKPKKTVEVPGMGKVFDFRGTGLLTPNGGRIRPLAFIHHIPVYPNQPGYEDFTGLASVLKNSPQGRLAVQSATDRDGNVALYTRLDMLCYHARGLNSASCGCEHMHMTGNEDWTKKQLRAAAWLGHRWHRDYGGPTQKAHLRPGGPGVAVVVRRGHTSHQHEADVAGYHDRSDPGPKFDWEYVFHCIRYYGRKHSFVGA